MKNNISEFFRKYKFNSILFKYFIKVFVIIIIIMLLGGYIKDATTKRSCKLTNKVYVEGSKPGMAICVEK